MDAFDLSRYYRGPTRECRLDLSVPPARIESMNSCPDPTEEDALTALTYRSLVLDRVQAAIRRHRSSRQSFALLLLDLDDFTSINAQYGRAAGDQVLHALAETLRSGLRRSDMATRFGGDEFAVVLEEIVGQHKVSRVMERILHQTSQPILVKGTSIRLTASLGCALYPQDGIEPWEILRRADQAMREAKGQGRLAAGREPVQHSRYGADDGIATAGKKRERLAPDP